MGLGYLQGKADGWAAWPAREEIFCPNLIGMIPKINAIEIYFHLKEEAGHCLRFGGEGSKKS